MQGSLFGDLCPCLASSKAVAGLCRSCYARRYRSHCHFGGHRETVLRRDHSRCRGCGELEQIVVHHRVPGVHTTDRLITLCARCHARVHRSFVLRRWVGELIVKLWREQHPQSPVQLQLELQGNARVLEQVA
jgi:hypothetical protein